MSLFNLVPIESVQYIRAAGLMGSRPVLVSEAGLHTAVTGYDTDEVCCATPDPLPNPVHGIACWSCTSGLVAGYRMLVWGQGNEAAVIETALIEDGMEPLSAILLAQQGQDELRSMAKLHKLGFLR